MLHSRAVLDGPLVIIYVSVRSKLQHPPLGIPWGFDPFAFLGIGNLDTDALALLKVICHRDGT